MNYERDEEMKLTEYLSLFFVGLLGLFNSSKLEVRQITIQMLNYYSKMDKLFQSP